MVIVHTLQPCALALDLNREEKNDNDNTVDDKKDNHEDDDGNVVDMNMESKP